jgi:hypothetical protein
MEDSVPSEKAMEEFSLVGRYQQYEVFSLP